jgi:fructose-bisphosphate aldolase class II
LGCLGSLETGEGDKEDGHGFEGKLDRDMLLTDPDQAADFVARTKVDALAVAIGTSHGAYKFTRKPTGDILAMDVVKAINERLPETHLVMHGSSSVPQDLQDIINEFGGEMPQTYGVPVEEIVTGIRNGVRKVNIDTDCRMAITGQFRKRVSQARDRGNGQALRRPFRGLRHSRQRFEDQTHPAGRYGQALSVRCARSEDREDKQSRLNRTAADLVRRKIYGYEIPNCHWQGPLQVRGDGIQENGLLGTRL